MATRVSVAERADGDVAAPIETVDVRVFEVATDAEEADGTLVWSSTTAVVVELGTDVATGIGWTYGPAAIAGLVRDELAPLLQGAEPVAGPALWREMTERLRNAGRPGLTSMAIAACDIAVWDLRAHLLGVPLIDLLGRARESVEAYGSGGFTNYTPDQLRHQIESWIAAGLSAIKIKVGSDPAVDPERVALAREAAGPDVALMVDANGAHDRKRALAAAVEYAGAGVSWFEEPVSSDDLAGLRLLRDHAPAPIEVAAGEYGYELPYFRRMLEAGAVDVLQADATRCAGFTEFLRVDALCRAAGVPLSAHCAPTLHAHVGCACDALRHVEYFHDHARVEPLLFDGALAPVNGRLEPDRRLPGMGVHLRADAARFEVEAA